MAGTEHADSLLPPIGEKNNFILDKKAQQKTVSIRSVKQQKALLRISRELLKTWYLVFLKKTQCALFYAWNTRILQPCTLCFFPSFSFLFLYNLHATNRGNQLRESASRFSIYNFSTILFLHISLRKTTQPNTISFFFF